MPLLDPAAEYFLATYDAGSVNAAARRLYVTNSVISRHISRLERELGTALFDRLSTGMVPTEAGRAFAGYARRVLAETTSIEAELQGRSATRARISVAAVGGVLHSVLPRVCASFHRRHPQSQIRVVRATPSQVSAMVKDGTVDVGVTYNLSLATDVVVRFSQQAVLQAVMSRSHPLSGARSVSVRQIATYPLALSLTTSTGRASSTSCRERSPTIGTASPPTTGRAWAGPRTGRRCTGSRTGERSRRWRSRSTSSGKSSLGPDIRPGGLPPLSGAGVGSAS